MIMKNTIKDFTDLIVWQKAHELTIEIYKSTGKFPKSEVFALVNQMRRASISIGSNIAEGFGRQKYKEKTHFYYIAQGSLTELKNQLMISRDIDYLTEKIFNDLIEKANEVHKVLQGLITKTKSYL